MKAAEGEAALTDKYTEESIAALQTAIDAANRVLADDNATQAEVDAQVEAVNAAKAALEEKKAPVVKEELEKAVADATEVVGATDKYTEAHLQLFSQQSMRQMKFFRIQMQLRMRLMQQYRL